MEWGAQFSDQPWYCDYKKRAGWEMTVRKFSDGSHFNGTPKEQVPGNWTIENGPFIDDLPIKIWNTVNFLSFLYVYHICGWFIDDLPIKWGYNSPIFSGLLMGATKGRFERWNALNPVPRLTVPRYVAPCYGLFVYKLARPCMYSLYIYSSELKLRMTFWKINHTD